MSKKVAKNKIYAKGFPIKIYTEDYQNEFISLTDIAFEFASWISPEFKLYIIQGYKHLKIEENGRSSLEWNLNREIVKINYRLQTEAIRKNLIAPKLAPAQAGSTYSGEADLLNVALFGKTAEQWKIENPDKKGSIRDYASADELLVLANMQSYNAILISNGVEQSKRILALNKFAKKQLGSINSLDVNILKKSG